MCMQFTRPFPLLWKWVWLVRLCSQSTRLISFFFFLWFVFSILHALLLPCIILNANRRTKKRGECDKAMHFDWFFITDRRRRGWWSSWPFTVLYFTTYFTTVAMYDLSCMVPTCLQNLLVTPNKWGNLSPWQWYKHSLVIYNQITQGVIDTSAVREVIIIVKALGLICRVG